MGSATAWWLARSGVEVILLEQFEASHKRGSSHGSSRIFRLAYPDPFYVNLAREALPLWRLLEEDSGTELLVTTGGIDYGDPISVQSIEAALVSTGVDHETVSANEAIRRWPGFAFDGPVLHQSDAGRILADVVVRTLHERAVWHGAEVFFEQAVRNLAPDSDDRIVVTTDVDRYRARCAVVTAGAWIGNLLDGLVDLPPLTVSREQVFHFSSRIGEADWPSYIHHGHTFIYGLKAPDDEGIKVAEHHTGGITTADGRSFDVDEDGLQRVFEHVVAHMPGLHPAPTSAATCLYTNTQDESFITQRHGPIVVGSACSGHGFKFVPLIGRQLAQLAMART